MILEFEIQKNGEAYLEFYIMGVDGHGKTGLTLGTFTEVVRKPDNTIKALTGETYSEHENGWYGLHIPANFCDTNGKWKVHINEHVDGGCFDGAAIIKVTEHDPNLDIAFIRDVAGGKWLIENNQLKFYKSDNVTLIATFNLKNAAGIASMQDVFVRERV